MQYSVLNILRSPKLDKTQVFFSRNLEMKEAGKKRKYVNNYNLRSKSIGAINGKDKLVSNF